MYSPRRASFLHLGYAMSDAFERLYRLKGVRQRVQLAHTVSARAPHGLASYVPASPSARQRVHGLQTLSPNSVQGLLSQVPGGHAVQRWHTLSMVSRVTLPSAQSRRLTKWSLSGQAAMLEQFLQAETSCLSLPAHVRCMYWPAGHTSLQGLHCASSSAVHSCDMYLCAPHVSRHDVHTEYLSTAQSLLTKLAPGTHWFGHVWHETVSFVPAPVHGGPCASRLGGQSRCVVHLAHPWSYVLPSPGHTGSASVR